MKWIMCSALLAIMACTATPEKLTDVALTSKGAQPWACDESDRGTCKLTPCSRGQVHQGEAQTCCWPGQTFDPVWGCSGAPSCPEGSVERDLSCKVIDAEAYYGPGCSREEPQDCQALANALWFGQGAQTNRPRAISLIKKGCETHRFAASCIDLADLLEGGTYLPKSEKESRKMHWRLCEETGEYGCRSRSTLKASNLNHRAQSLERVTRACETLKLPESEICVWSIRLRMKFAASASQREAARAQIVDMCVRDKNYHACNHARSGLQGDTKKRVANTYQALRAQRCEQGYSLSCDPKVRPTDVWMNTAEQRCREDQDALWCHWFGSLQYHHLTEEDALATFSHNCLKRHYPDSCQTALHLWTKKNHKTKGKDDIFQALGIVCKQGESLACAQLGHLLINKKDAFEQAAPHFEMSCSLKKYFGCYGLGRVAEKRGDHEEATRRYKEACEKQIRGACHDLGLLSLQTTPKSPAIANKYFALGCGLSVKNSCYELAKSYEQGRGFQADAMRALGYHEKACRLGRTESCSVALSHYSKTGAEREVRSLVRTACKFVPDAECDVIKRRWLSVITESM